MKRLIVLLVTVVLGITLLTSCARKPEEVKIGYLPITGDLPLFVAVEKGFFKQKGLKVELVQFREAKEAMDALLAGQVDILAPISLTPIFAVEQNQPGMLKMALPGGESEGHVVSHLLVKPDSKIMSIEDLKGKKIGTYVGGAHRMWLELFLKRIGLEPKRDVTIVQVAPTLLVPSLVAGQYDALYATEPYTSTALVKGMAVSLVDNPRSKYILNPFISGASVVFTTKILQEKPKTVRKVYQAMKKGVEFIETNELEAKKTIPKYVPVEEEVVLKSDVAKFYIDVTPEIAEAIQKEANFLFEYGLLTKKIDIKNILLTDGDFK